MTHRLENRFDSTTDKSDEWNMAKASRQSWRQQRRYHQPSIGHPSTVHTEMLRMRRQT
jgi:hypothetical protein